MKLDGNQLSFLGLLRAGLWDTVNPNLRIDGSTDWEKVYQLAGEQSVVGLVTAGIERFKNDNPHFSIQQEALLQMIGEVQMIEQTNMAMNLFIEKIVGAMREADIYTLLLKGQGIAQCYERPLWRSPGDVDFLMSIDNYKKASRLLAPLSSCTIPERLYSKEVGLTIDSWLVEIHGTQRTGLSYRVDKVVDDVQKDVFYGGNVRSWINGKTTVFLPSPDNDVFFVFTHYIKHFYKEGMNLRQICDWCRLLWTYRDSLNPELLEMRIRKAGLMGEWKTFAALAVEYLGMPVDAMPMYDPAKKWSKKADKLLAFILRGGEWRKYHDTLYVAQFFPVSTLRFLPGILFNMNLLKIKERMLSGTRININNENHNDN